MSLSPLRNVRRGAALAEAALVVTVILTLVLGMLDLGVGVLRNNILSEAARHGARQAAVHGKLADKLGKWGTTAIDQPASASGVPIVDAVRPLLVGMDLNETRISVTWIDGGNDPEQRVRVTVTSPYRPMMAFIFGNWTVTLRASSTMPIAH